MPTDQEAITAEPQVMPTSSVGNTLKSARERMGKDLAQVAAQLRIRKPFLDALEDGRHKDLPGGTYAVGFLRTYAEFLSLDGEEMVRRFRLEAAGELSSRAELVFPSPVSEGRIPGGAVLFVGLVLAGIGYGAWYWLSSKDAAVADMVPALPDRLANVLHRTETPPPETKPVEVKPVEAKPVEPAVPAVDAKPEVIETAKPVAPAAEIVPPAEEEENKPQVSTKPVESQQAIATKPAEPPPPPAAATEAPKPVEAVKPAESAPAPEGRIVGQENTGSRITLRASTDDCWVQVREMDGQLLLSRLLRKGDSYVVPNRPGLTLMVGNAGAIDIVVDGKTTPAVGGLGQVRRDIKLDPDKLVL